MSKCANTPSVFKKGTDTLAPCGADKLWDTVESELTYQVGCIIAINTGPNMVGLIFRS